MSAPSLTVPTPTLEVRSPVDGALVGTAPVHDGRAVAAAAADLRVEQVAWSAAPLRERIAWLTRFRDWILDHEVELVDLIQHESGKVRHEARAEISVVADFINYTVRIAPRALRDKHPAPHGLLGGTKRLTLRYRPYELVGVISPWNFPLAMALMDSVPALAAGAAVLAKPSEVTPLSLRRAVDGWHETGAPAVLSCVTGRAETGRAVVDVVDYIQFTGSTSTGREVGRRAAERLIPCGLELGGKDAMIVLADADLDRAARGAAWGSLFNTGQACVAVERIYVEDAVHDAFIEKLVAQVECLDQRPSGDVGSMTSRTQLDLVEAQLKDALSGGARVLTGAGATGRGLEFQPTVLVDVDHSMACMKDETFGPLLPVMRVQDAEEAVRLANDSDYGLSASIWTKNLRRGHDLAQRLEVGAVNLNDVMANVMSYAVPQAGWKASGIGARFGGAAAIHKYCRPQAVTAPLASGRSEPNWFPYSPMRSEALHRAVRAVVGRGKRRFR